MQSDFLKDGEPVTFIQAANCGPARSGVVIDLLVVHTMESLERVGTAVSVARWFGGKAAGPAPQASAHYCVDSAEIIQCVSESVVAWAAPGANKNGIHIEHAGCAAQSIEEWNDPYSLAELALSARLAADICKRHAIPIIRLSVDDLKARKRGLCGHVDITNAFNNGKGHTDPGASFPWDRYLEMVHQAAIPPTIPPALPDTVPENA